MKFGVKAFEIYTGTTEKNYNLEYIMIITYQTTFLDNVLT